jgi:hypothetical protein
MDEARPTPETYGSYGWLPGLDRPLAFIIY